MRTVSSRPRALPLAIAASALLLLPGASGLAAAQPWLPPVRIATDASHTDAAARGTAVAITYRDTLGLHVAMSPDGGTAFRHRLVVGPDVTLVHPPQVATCRGDALVLTHERTPKGVDQLRLALVPGREGRIRRVTVAREVSRGLAFDLACGPDRAVVGWTQGAGSDWEGRLRAVRLPDLALAPVRDLGPADRLGVAVAVATDAEVVAVAGPAGTVVTRTPLTAAGSAAAATAGSLIAGLRRPVLAADGRSVALAGRAAGLTWIRLSADGGRTFATRTPFTGGTLGSLAVRARWVAATLVAPAGDDGGQLYRRAYSDDRGVSWKLAPLALGLVAEPIEAFVSVPEGVRLTETWTTGTTDPGSTHAVLFHRHS